MTFAASYLFIVNGFRYSCVILYETMGDVLAREFLLAFWKIDVLHHARQRDGVYGQWMLHELRRHGYELSPGTLYPLLSRMEARGWLRANASDGPKTRRVYRLTVTGGGVLRKLAKFVDELHREMVRDRAVPQQRGRGVRASRVFR